MKPEQKNKRKSLNILQLFRGLAAIAVTLFHIDFLIDDKFGDRFFWHIFQFGWTGVDYFLVLSGFIIIYTQHRSLLKPNLERFKDFLLKRFIRIYPLYWFVSLGILALLAIVPGLKNNNPITLSSIIKSFLLFPPSETILNVGWTLTVIFFFYLIFSLNYILPRRLFFTVVGIIVIGSSTQFISAFAVSPTDNAWFALFFNLLYFEFVFGCIAAYFVLKYSLRYRKTIFFAGLGLLLLFSFFQTYGLIDVVNVITISGIDFNINRVIFSGIPCFFLIMGAASIDINEEVKIPQFLIYLGDASYSIYLVHSPVISALIQLTLKFGIQDTIGGSSFLGFLIFVISIGLSCIFYNLIEKPLTQYLRKQFIQKKTSPIISAKSE
ncbi:MAG: acyltransferase [Cyanobacteria bacterium SBLK]|nr:acyltransferase [Cyanobacteria bacterium SBLK]